MAKIVIMSNKSGAMVDFRYELIQELLKTNEVIIATPIDDKMDQLRKLKVKIVEIKMERRSISITKDLKLLASYRKLMKNERPDLVITYTIKPNIYGGLACRLLKIPYAENITGLGTGFQKDSFIKQIIVKLYKIALRRAKVVFFENTENRDTMVSLKTCSVEQTCVLSGAGVNLEKFGLLEYPENDVFHFLFIGRVMKEKGINELIEAMKKMVSNGYLCTLDVIGPCEEDYIDQLKEMEQAGLLTYYGYQPNVQPFINNSDCFVLPSWHEGMANTNLECAASGRPVITSNISGCKEAVIEGVSGLLCEPKNVDSLYAAMKEMVQKPRDEREAMGHAGRKHMEDVFNKKDVVAKTIKKMFSN